MTPAAVSLWRVPGLAVVGVLGGLSPEEGPGVVSAGGGDAEVAGLRRDILRHRVCTVVGAAGWAKTSAVASAVRDEAVAWLALEAGDADPDRFLGRLRAALADLVGLQDGGPHGRDDSTLGSAGTVRGLLDAVGGEFVLVLDDVHELPDRSRTTALLERLCQAPVAGLHLVLVSRRELPFALTRLRGQGEVADVDATGLALDVNGIAGVLDTSLDPVTGAQQILEATAGWPAVAHLAARAVAGLNSREWRAALDHALGPGGRVHAYLREEVLAAEPAAVVEFLRQVAVLGEVSSVTCRDLGVGDADALLGGLTRRGLVRVDRDGPLRWSVIGPLRTLLAAEMAPEQAAQLHRRAAEVLSAADRHVEALRHLAAAGDHDGVAGMLVERGNALIEQGAAPMVLAVARLALTHQADPRVQRVLGRAFVVNGRVDEAMAMYRRAAGADGVLDPGLGWQMGLVCYLRGNLRDAVDIFRRVRLGAEDTADEANLLVWAARTHLMIGDSDTARDEAVRALAAAQRSADASALAAAHAALADLALAEGDQRRVSGHLRAALDAAGAGNNVLQLSVARIQQAFHLIEQGQVDQALGHAEEALELAERCGHIALAAFALFHRARARARAGDHDDALRDYERARELFGSFGSRLMAWPVCGIADIHRARGQLAESEAGYQEALRLAEPHHDVFGLSCALIGLARVSAAADPDAAETFADRAVALGPCLRHVQVLLTRGWVALAARDRPTAADYAARAVAEARKRRDGPGLAEALELTALADPAPAERVPALEEAAALWGRLRHPVEEALARLVAAELGHAGPVATTQVSEVLRRYRVRLEPPHAAGPLAVVARSAPRVSIRALGTLQVYYDGKPVPSGAWHSRKARDVLRILLARRGGPVPRDQLMELLWPEEDPHRAGTRLSTLLSMVRAVLEPDHEAEGVGLVIATREAVWLDRNQVDIDVDRFLDLAVTALDQQAAHDNDAVGLLTAAEAAYTGEFLEDTPYLDWAVPLREEVREAYLAVLRALVAACTETGDWDRAVRYGLRMLSQDAYDERAHLAVVRILVRAGRHGEARRRYRHYVNRMTELGVSPAPFPG